MPWLEWLDRAKNAGADERAKYHLLEPVKTKGYGEDVGNLLIQGDNLLALKALLPYYKGEVKCVYIDPPYNSETAFKHYDDKLEHAQWLSAIHPRLRLLKKLMAEDGVIFVSIDDQEGHYLKVLMDEVFGRANFVATFIWQKVDSPNDNKVPVAPDHEFILCYEKNKKQGKLRKLGDQSVLDAYTQRDEEGRLYRDRLLRKNGKNSLLSDRPTMGFPLTDPDGNELIPTRDDGKPGVWALSNKGIKKAKDEGRLIWKKRIRESDGAEVWVPYTREFAPTEPSRPHPTILLDVKTSRQAKAHQTELLPEEVAFDTVKPEQLMQRLLSMCTSPGDLVLDAYAGTGTTLAVAMKMGRRCITIEEGDHIATHTLPRLKKVVDGEQGGVSEDLNWTGGGGFRYYKVGTAIFNGDGDINEGVRFNQLAQHVWFSETGTPRKGGEFDSPYLGEHDGKHYYLLFNGVLGDQRPKGGNVLTLDVLKRLPKHTGKKVIFAEANLLDDATMRKNDIVFRLTPYAIKAA